MADLQLLLPLWAYLWLGPPGPIVVAGIELAGAVATAWALSRHRQERRLLSGVGWFVLTIAFLAIANGAGNFHVLTIVSKAVQGRSAPYW